MSVAEVNSEPTPAILVPMALMASVGEMLETVGSVVLPVPNPEVIVRLLFRSSRLPMA